MMAIHLNYRKSTLDWHMFYLWLNLTLPLFHSVLHSLSLSVRLTLVMKNMKVANLNEKRKYKKTKTAKLQKNSSCVKHSFSKLSLTKNIFRSMMTQKRLNYVAIMSIENDVIFGLILIQWLKSLCKLNRKGKYFL